MKLYAVPSCRSQRLSRHCLRQVATQLSCRIDECRSEATLLNFGKIKRHDVIQDVEAWVELLMSDDVFYHPDLVARMQAINAFLLFLHL